MQFWKTNINPVVGYKIPTVTYISKTKELAKKKRNEEKFNQTKYV